MRCASIHRKLGVHVSKIKSLSMDTWSIDQVDVCETHTVREARRMVDDGSAYETCWQ